MRNPHQGADMDTVQCRLLSFRAHIPDLRCGVDIPLSLGRRSATGGVDRIGGDRHILFHTIHRVLVCAQERRIEMGMTGPVENIFK